MIRIFVALLALLMASGAVAQKKPTTPSFDGNDVVFCTQVQGDPYVAKHNEQVNDIGGQLFVADKSARPQQRLFSSWKSSAAARFFWGEMDEYETCHEGQTAQEALPTLKYTPPPRILNAAYPVTLEQTP